jgi:peroxiredoxin Q/BCP
LDKHIGKQVLFLKRIEVQDMIDIKLLSAFAVLFIAVAGMAASSAIPQPGSTAPPFALKSQEGTEVKLNDFRGKWVVLYFYPKDFTPGCTIEAHNFQRDLAGYEKLNAVIVGVSVDSAESHKGFCAKEGLSFKLLADTGHKVSGLYGSLGEYKGTPIAARNTFIIDPEGRIAKVFEGVKPAGHSEEVLAALKQLSAR